ncbi:hypothetical protein IM792_14850 [Mucilaginibacter sp. JRF]|uniref:hypothetical protein n=1 Tax=Mucilaginibacter sp. JRF TaxID=2780088 RepID=UPI00187F9E8A|nr:hypothetical protein [Mucilaginibacter sp. JRF]MBE9585732.1 hypothetical protein [Mucilaginibacter sp. JRF]
MFKKPEEDLKIDVIGVLSKIQDNGWDVYEIDKNRYRILINESDSIEVIDDPGGFKSHVSCIKAGKIKSFEQATTTHLFVNEISKAGKTLGVFIDVEKPITSARLIAAEPASNKSKFRSMIGNRIVNAIFDPYFDAVALQNFLSLSRLGVTLNKNLRILLAEGRKAKTFDKNFLQDFQKELEISAEVKQCKSEKEHRRFLLLDDGATIIVGCSFNNLEKNEVLFEERSSEDLAFFEAEWNAGSYI